MTARTHDAIAFASLLTVATLYPPESLNLFTVFASVIATDIGSILPDIDQASNRLWDLLPAGDALGKVFRKVFIKHRTLSHSLLGAFLFYKFFGWVLPKLLNSTILDVNVVFISLMIGYFSHLVADSFTKDGLPLFFPFRVTIGIPPIKALRIKSDGWIEKFIILPAVAVYIILFISSYQARMLEIISLIK